MSRNKKNWDQLVDFQGNYIDLSNIGSVPGPKGEPGVGLPGSKGDLGDPGPKGGKGDDAPPFLHWVGEVYTQADLPTDPGALENGDVYRTQDTGYLYIWGDVGGWTEINNFDLVTGPEGDQGQKGLQGDQGDQGIKGATGEKGNAGEKGDTGSDGEKGEQGDDGIVGPGGADGAQGVKGVTGSQGVKGEQGPAGTGIDIIGSIPDAGPPTSSGDAAGDAYLDINGNIWISDGNDNWINAGPIQGPQGTQGEQGVDGPQGAQGNQGIQGVQGMKGSTGSEGEKGTKGDVGLTGDKGDPAIAVNIIGGYDQPGPPPTSTCDTAGNGLIDVNGVIWVCDGSGTWIESPAVQGVKGEKGQTGEVGATGNKGDQGVQGIQGVQGLQGIDGLQGTAGTNGVDGAAGQKGDRGEQGLQGESPFSFKGNKDLIVNLPTADNEIGDVWYVEEDDKYYAWSGSEWKAVDLSTNTMPEPTDDDLLYGRARTNGSELGTWTRAVSLAGDTMTGALVAPTLTTGPDADDKGILNMTSGGVTYELEADSTFVKFGGEYLAKQEDVTTLSNTVVNLAENQEVMAPTEMLSVYMLGDNVITDSGEFYLFKDSGTFNDVTHLVLDPIDHTGNDNSANFANLVKGQYVTVLSVSTPYGFTARIARDPEIDPDPSVGQCTLILEDVRAMDADPAVRPEGGYTIKVQNFIDPKNIQEINNIIDGFGGTLNHVADYRSVVLMDDKDTPPAFLPSNNPIPDGKLYFNTKYLQLYIRLGDSWLGLL